MTKQIPLTQGKVALVDDADFEDVSRFNWHAHKGRKGNWYARRAILKIEEPDPKKRRNRISLHRHLLGNVDGEIDHKNRDGLDNRRTNLRVATRELNAINTGAYATKRGTTYRGVQYCHSRSNLTRRWIVRFESKGRKFFLGYHATAEDAAHAYDAKARELFGEFAYLNFPDQGATV